MSDDLEPAVRTFLAEADAIYDEYDQGYMDADVAMSRLRTATRELHEAVEE